MMIARCHRRVQLSASPLRRRRELVGHSHDDGLLR